MKTYRIVASQNGWEYTGNYIVKCNKGIEQIDKYTIRIDKEILMIFDDEIIVEAKQ